MKTTDKITLTFGQLKRLISESQDDWNWCVAKIGFGGQLKSATYSSWSGPWPGDVSARQTLRGEWCGECQTETREEAERLLKMMREHDRRTHVAPYHYQYRVVSRDEFEENVPSAREIYNNDMTDDLPGDVYLDKSRFVEETRELHAYPEEIETKIISRLTGGNDQLDLNKAYWNSEARVFWFFNNKGYLHILKPVNFKQIDGSIIFGLKDLIIKDDGMMEEINRYRFIDKDEAIEWLKNKYRFDETPLEEKKKKRKKKTKIHQARFFPKMIMPFPPKPPKGGPGPAIPPGPGPNHPPPQPPPAGPAPSSPALAM